MLSRKYALIEWLVKVENPDLITQVEKIYESSQPNDQDWWDDLSEDEKLGIAEGIEELDQGDSFSYEEVRKGIREKFGI